MSESMLDRAARAARVVNRDVPNLCSLDEASRIVAAAVIKELREPTVEQCMAALRELSDCTVPEPKAAAWDAIRAYRAMIDAILQEQTS